MQPSTPTGSPRGTVYGQPQATYEPPSYEQPAPYPQSPAPYEPSTTYQPPAPYAQPPAPYAQPPQVPFTPGQSVPQAAGQPLPYGQPPRTPFRPQVSEAPPVPVRSGSARRTLTVGAAWFGGGLLLSLVTFTSSSPVFVVAWGPMIYGAALLVKGGLAARRERG